MENNEINKVTRSDIYQVDPRLIDVQENFNVRQNFDIDELREQIRTNGVLTPITLLPYTKDGETRYKLVDGERRYRSVISLIAEGVDFKRIKAILLNKSVSEEELYVQQAMRNEGKRFTDYEYARLFSKFKENFGYSQTEIAQKFGKKDSYVSNCLKLLNLPTEIQQSIQSNEISTTAALQVVNSTTDEVKQIEAVKEAVATAKEKGKSGATGKDISGDAKIKADTNIIKKGIETLYKYLGDIDIDSVVISDVLNAIYSKQQITDIIGSIHKDADVA